jgi:hypothetical protein
MMKKNFNCAEAGLENTYYCPEWTCGRYSATARVALIYNLIEGMCYFLEDYSAAVIGEGLLTKRNSNRLSKQNKGIQT